MLGLTTQQQQPFYGPLSRTTRVSRYQKKHSPTHHPDQLLPSTTIHSILPRSNYMLGNLSAQPLSMSSLVYLFVWSPPPHIPYISSNQCLLFAAHAHTIAICFAKYQYYITTRRKADAKCVETCESKSDCMTSASWSRTCRSCISSRLRCCFN